MTRRGRCSTLIGWQAVVPRLAIRRFGTQRFHPYRTIFWYDQPVPINSLGVIMRLAVFVLLMASTAIAENATFQVQTADNETEAHLSGTLKLTTDFGYAVVDVIKIDELQVKTRSTLTVSDGTVLRGELDWSDVAIEPTEDGIEAAEIVSLSAIRRAEPKPGVTTTGRAANRISYYLRAPQGLLFGKAMAGVAAAAWIEHERQVLRRLGGRTLAGTRENTLARGNQR